jgi:hypothetical protein
MASMLFLGSLTRAQPENTGGAENNGKKNKEL